MFFRSNKINISNKIDNCPELKENLNAPQADSRGFVAVLGHQDGKDFTYCDAQGKMQTVPLLDAISGTENTDKIIAYAHLNQFGLGIDLFKQMDDNPHITSLVLNGNLNHVNRFVRQVSPNKTALDLITEYLCNNTTITSVYFDHAEHYDVSYFKRAIKNSNNTTLKHVAFNAYPESGCIPSADDPKTTVYNLDAMRAKHTCSIM